LFTVSDRPALNRGGSEIGPTIVWLWGEHDLATDGALSLTLARAIALGTPGLVLDMSEVEFIGASTLGTIVRAREFLRQRSEWLTVRSPSAFARRVINACGLADLLDAGPEMERNLAGTALGSWVEVPAAERANGQPRPSAPVPDRAPALVGRTSALRETAVSTDGLAETA
jgi:anti-anti-sigma factor